MNPFINYAIQFIIGGGTVVGATMLAKNLDPKYAAILYAIPLQFTISAIAIYLNTSKETTIGVLKSSIFTIMLTVGFIFLFFMMIRRMNFWLSLGMAYAVFISAAFALMRFL